MNARRFSDALSEIDQKYVEESRPKGRKKKRPWVAGVAAVLALAILGGILFWRGGKPERLSPVPGSLKSFAVSVPEYPKTVPYPSSEATGYKEWIESRRERNQFCGAGRDLDGFFTAACGAALGRRQENTVFSPLNAFMALAMLAELTDGESRAQILAALGVEDMETLRDKAYRLWNANYSNDGAVTSILGNSVWLSKKIDYRQETLDTLAKSHYAASFWGDFADSRYAGAMQAWINEQTGELLREQVDSQKTDPDTVFTLLSTLYFRARWTDEFQQKDTEDGVFHSKDGDGAVPFMRRDLKGRYYYGERFGAVSLPLRESGAMWFLLPDEGVTPAALFTDAEAMALVGMADDWEALNGYEKSKFLKLHLSVPRFDVGSVMNLNEAVRSLGVTDVFDMAKSDFTPLTENTPVAVSEIRHGARVAVDEEGVAAAAFTAIQGAGATEPPAEEMDFVIDRPFAFVVTGWDGLPLFAGTVWEIA